MKRACSSTATGVCFSVRRVSLPFSMREIMMIMGTDYAKNTKPNAFLF